MEALKGYTGEGSVITQQTEAKEKSSKHLISNAAGFVSRLAPLLAFTPLAEFAPAVTEVSALASKLLPSIGLSQPIDVMAPTRMVVSPNITPAHGSGLCIGSRLALRQESSTGACTIMGSGVDWNIHHIIERPSLVAQYTFNNTTANDTQLFYIQADPSVLVFGLNFPTAASTVIYPSYLNYMSQFFAAWRGSIKFVFQFITSGFTSARFRISHLPTYVAPTSYENTQGSYPSAIVDVRGDTTFPFVVPYIDPQPYIYPAIQPVSPSTRSFVHLSLVNNVVTPDAGGVSTIYLNVWAAAGEDFTFMLLKGFALNYQYANNVAAVTPYPGGSELPTNHFDYITYASMAEYFAKPFAPLIPARMTLEQGLVNPEHFGSIYEIARRVEYYPGTISVVDLNTTAPLSSNFNALRRLFLFWRGGLRCNFIDALNPINGWAPPNILVSDAQGCGAMLTPFFSSPDQATSCIQPYTLEIPWYRPRFFEEIEPYLSCYASLPVNIVQQNSGNLDSVITPAEDFQFGYLCAPPSYSIVYTPPGN